MAGTTDKLRGRMKQAAGDLSGDRSLRREGSVDRGEGALKSGIAGIADRVRSLLRRRSTSTHDTTARSGRS